MLRRYAISPQQLRYACSSRPLFNLFKQKQPESAENLDDSQAPQISPENQDTEYDFIKRSEDEVSNQDSVQADKDGAGGELKEYDQVQIRPEETKVLWDYYATQEEEGLERFDNALSKHSSFNSQVVQSKDLRDLSTLIAKTNKRLQLQFKREHKYELELHEEQLYKEVMFDARPSYLQLDHHTQKNQLKKARAGNAMRNVHQESEQMKKIIEWPEHK